MKYPAFLLGTCIWFASLPNLAHSAGSPKCLSKLNSDSNLLLKCQVDAEDLRSALSPPFTWMGSVNISPVQENGHIRGTRFVRVQPDSLFRCLLLESGDRLVSVDQEIVTPTTLMGLPRTLDQNGKLELRVIRAGKERTYTCTKLGDNKLRDSDATN